jgi:hypothetical protein
MPAGVLQKHKATGMGTGIVMQKHSSFFAVCIYSELQVSTFRA